jgi:hypothetical protein
MLIDHNLVHAGYDFSIQYYTSNVYIYMYLRQKCRSPRHMLSYMHLGGGGVRGSLEPGALEPGSGGAWSPWSGLTPRPLLVKSGQRPFFTT